MIKNGDKNWFNSYILIINTEKIKPNNNDPESPIKILLKKLNKYKIPKEIKKKCAEKYNNEISLL